MADLLTGATVWLVPKTLGAPAICFKGVRATVIDPHGPYATVRVDGEEGTRSIHVDNLVRSQPTPPSPPRAGVGRRGPGAKAAGPARRHGRGAAVVRRPDPIVVELTRRRKALKLTQPQLAERIGYSTGSHSQISKWEHGQASPFFASVRLWADALGCDIVLIPREGR